MEAQATNPRDRLMVRLLFRLGCRVSELLSVRPEDVDLESGLVVILHLKQRLKLSCPGCGARLGRAHRFCPGCGHKVAEAVRREMEHRRLRTLPLDAESLRMVHDYLAGGQTIVDRLFPIGRRQAWKIVRDCAQRTGLTGLVNPETGKSRGVSPHRLRDAFAVHALKVDDSGDGMRLLQEQLGHANFNTTARYRKVSGSERREWYERLWPATVSRPEAGATRTGESHPGRQRRQRQP